MYGVVGYPSKVAKTVIVGKKADLVCRLLYILTYFIRCSELHESQEKREQVIMEYNEQQRLAMAMESGYYSDFSKEAMDSEDYPQPDQTHHLESSLETVEETSESLASPVESGLGSVRKERKLTLTNCVTGTSAVESEDGERTPVGCCSPNVTQIKCKDDEVVDSRREFSAPVGNAPPPPKDLPDLCTTANPAIQERTLEIVAPGRNSDWKDLVITCKDDVFLERKCETEVAIGHADISSAKTDILKLPLLKNGLVQQTCESAALIEHHPQVIRCKEDTVLDAKIECVMNVGRSAILDTNPISCLKDKSDNNEHTLVNGYASGDSTSSHIACESKVTTDSVNHRRNCNTVKPCTLPGLKLASKQCNSGEHVDGRVPGGRRSPEVKEAHDLYCHSDTKLDADIPQETVKNSSFLQSLSSNPETERPGLLRSLSSNSSTSSVFSSDNDSGLWMSTGVNKGSEVIADNHPASTNIRYNRCVSNTSVQSSTSSTRSYDTDGTLTPDHEELPLPL